jgi:glyoxylase-like metal-dependent hydrolase (beta-lactamase superfamily II)
MTCTRILFVMLSAAAATAEVAEDGKITVERLAGSVYVLRSDGYDPGNIVASVGDDGIVMVDDRDASSAYKILAALKSISDQPLRFVINTHVHGDHTSGNPVFRKLAPIIAHRNVRTRMISGGEKLPPAAWPTVTFDGEMNLYLNGEDVRLLKLPTGHTDGDVVVFFTKANVVHMGDVFIAPAASFGDRSNGGSILALIEALKFVLPQIPADAKVVPSHGAISSRADVARGLEILTAMKAIVEAGIAAGKTKELMIAEKPFDKWKGSVAWFIPPDGYVSDFYKELTAK